MPHSGDELEKYNILPIILVIDVSGNDDEAVEGLNEELAGLHDTVTDFVQKHSYYRVILSVITYSSGAQILWNAVDFEDFYWNPIKTFGLSDLGSGLSKLPEVIRNIYGRGNRNHKVLNPTIIFIAKNHPTDNYEKQLDLLKKQNWFLLSPKIAFNYGGDFDATEIFCGITENIEATNIPMWDFNDNVLSMLQGRFIKYDNITYDDNYYDAFHKDLLKVDPIKKLPEYQITLNGNQTNIEGQLSIARCQVSPCELIDAKKIVFTICENDGNIEITNKEFNCYAEFCVEASTSRTFNNCLNKKLQFVFENNDAKDIEIDTDTENSSISIKNNCDDDIFIRVEFLPNTTMDFIDNDRLIDESNRRILCVKKMYYEDITGSTVGQIPEEPLMGDIGWDDDDNTSTGNGSDEHTSGWDEEW